MCREIGRTLRELERERQRELERLRREREPSAPIPAPGIFTPEKVEEEELEPATV